MFGRNPTANLTTTASPSEEVRGRRETKPRQMTEGRSSELFGAWPLLPHDFRSTLAALRHEFMTASLNRREITELLSQPRLSARVTGWRPRSRYRGRTGNRYTSWLPPAIRVALYPAGTIAVQTAVAPLPMWVEHVATPRRSTLRIGGSTRCRPFSCGIRV